jgi:phosphatidate cytidylyltransferase
LPDYPGAAAILAGNRLSEDLGLFITIMVFAGVFLGDTGAYFVGKKWGRHKLAPAVSPKKTWEGFFGGWITACLSAVLVNLVFGARFSYGHALAIGGLIGIFGVLGDLVESQIKRDAGIKDSGTLFPGHGGMLDRLDSILFSFPVVYYYVKIIFALNLV